MKIQRQYVCVKNAISIPIWLIDNNNYCFINLYELMIFQCAHTFPYYCVELNKYRCCHHSTWGLFDKIEIWTPFLEIEIIQSFFLVFIYYLTFTYTVIELMTTFRSIFRNIWVEFVIRFEYVENDVKNSRSSHLTAFE